MFTDGCISVYGYLITSWASTVFMDIFKYVLFICLLMGVLVCMDTL